MISVPQNLKGILLGIVIAIVGNDIFVKQQ